MDLLTTKQVSALWGISTRRVTVLASQGRIPGAQQIDGRWFIPKDAPKPNDPRKDELSSRFKKCDKYISLFPLSTIYYEGQVESFSAEEKELYRLNVLYEQGSFAEARLLAEKLLSSSNQYIRLGALYLLPTICMYTSDYKATDEYFVLFHVACQDIEEHRTEIDFFAAELDGELISATKHVSDVELADISTYPDELLPSICLFRLIAAILRYESSGVKLDISSYEIVCRLIEEKGLFYHAMLLHVYISIYYSFDHDTDRELAHMKRALEIGLRHDTLFTVSYTLLYSLETANAVLCEYPEEIQNRVMTLSDIFTESRNGYAAYRNQSNILSQLNKDDYKLLSLCLKEYSIEKMAQYFGLTRSGINKRISNLCGKFGVKSRKALLKIYLNSLLDWGKN